MGLGLLVVINVAGLGLALNMFFDGSGPSFGSVASLGFNFGFLYILVLARPTAG